LFKVNQKSKVKGKPCCDLSRPHCDRDLSCDLSLGNIGIVCHVT